MKKLGFLIVGAFLFIACDSTPGGNKDVMPVKHEGVAEEHHGEHDHDAHKGHEEHGEEGHDHESHAGHDHGESKDSVKVEEATPEKSH